MKHFDTKNLPSSTPWAPFLCDSATERDVYFKGMWSSFTTQGVDLVFFDPDNGLANITPSQRPMAKGRRKSCKMLFQDEVGESLQMGFSALLYQHFLRKERKQFTSEVARNLMNVTGIEEVVSFSTPHVVFLFLPHPYHQELLANGVLAVEDSAWSAPKSARTSEKSDFKQILVQRHSMP